MAVAQLSRQDHRAVIAGNENEHTMPIRSALSIALLLNLMIGLAAPVAAQSDSGSLSVRVTDETGAAGPGATVVVRQVATGSTRELTTDRSGRALFSMLPSGTYDSTVSLA